MFKLKNKSVFWGGYKNTIIPKMLREVFDPQGGSRGGFGGGGGGGSYSGLTIPTPSVPSTQNISTPSIVTPGNLPLTVTFTNTSTGEDLTYLWNFGDGSTSTALNPTHIYSTAGTYTVKLTTTNVRSSDTKIVTGAITATGTTTDTGDGPPEPDEYPAFSDPDFDSTAGGRIDLEE